MFSWGWEGLQIPQVLHLSWEKLFCCLQNKPVSLDHSYVRSASRSRESKWHCTNLRWSSTITEEKRALEQANVPWSWSGGECKEQTRASRARAGLSSSSSACKRQRRAEPPRSSRASTGGLVGSVTWIRTIITVSISAKRPESMLNAISTLMRNYTQRPSPERESPSLFWTGRRGSSPLSRGSRALSSPGETTALRPGSHRRRLPSAPGSAAEPRSPRRAAAVKDSRPWAPTTPSPRKSPVTSSGFVGRGRHAPPRQRARGGGAEQQPGDPSERRHPLSVLGPPPEPELRRRPAGDTAAARTAARRVRACALRSHREPDLERQRAAAALLRMRHRSAGRGREEPLVTWASPRVDNEGGGGERAPFWCWGVAVTRSWSRLGGRLPCEHPRSSGDREGAGERWGGSRVWGDRRAAAGQPWHSSPEQKETYWSMTLRTEKVGEGRPPLRMSMSGFQRLWSV